MRGKASVLIYQPIHQEFSCLRNFVVDIIEKIIDLQGTFILSLMKLLFSNVYYYEIVFCRNRISQHFFSYDNLTKISYNNKNFFSAFQARLQEDNLRKQEESVAKQEQMRKGELLSGSRQDQKTVLLYSLYLKFIRYIFF